MLCMFYLFWYLLLRLKTIMKEEEILSDFLMGFLIVLCQIIWNDFGAEYFQQILLHLALKVFLLLK